MKLNETLGTLGMTLLVCSLVAVPACGDDDDDQTPDLVFSVDLSAIPGGSQIDVFASNDAEDTPGVALVALLADQDGTTLVIDPD